MEINLISDTVTKPTAEMMYAMMHAEVGDDVFKKDPTINALESKVAKLFGMEAALYFPSGTMANQTAIKIHTQPGDQVICDKYAHIFNYEGGGVSFNSGASCKLIDGYRGMMTAEQVEAAINPPDFYHSPLDGARLWNALVAKNETAAQYGNLFDTISVCLSKGLGCPVGSVLVGTEEAMQKALRIRKIFGGGMRQAGFLAAAGIYALDNHIERLADDHKRAKELEATLSALSIVKTVEPVETNIVIFEIDTTLISEADFMATLQKHKISIIGMGQGKLRMVTHMDYTAEMHDATLTILKTI